MKSKYKIFIVEDEIVVANDIMQILNANGFDVVGIATKYYQAKTNITNLSPDIVLCDIHLNEQKSGIELMQELSETMIFKIIFISAYSDINTIKESNLVNPFNFLVKPFNDQQLITSVRLACMTINTNESICLPTKRELTIIKLISNGLNSKEIADKLFISKNTVDTHRRKLLKKYSAKGTSELVTLFINQKWI